MNLGRLARLVPPGSGLHRLLLLPEAPELALEVRENALGLVRAAVEGGALRVQAATSVTLAPGTLHLSLTEPNVADPAAFGAALASLLDRCGAAGARRAAVVLPDGVGRLRLFPEAELRASSPAQSLELARFRLKKALPYDVREARVAVALPDPGRGDGVVAVIARAVVESYEQACAAAGLWAGRVELSSAALTRRLAGRPGTLLLVNRDEGWASLLLMRDGWPLLVRTLQREAAPDAASIVREIRATCAFASERLQARPEIVLVRDAGGDASLFGIVGAALGVPVEIVPGPEGVPHAQAAGLAGALAALGEAA